MKIVFNYDYSNKFLEEKFVEDGKSRSRKAEIKFDSENLSSEERIKILPFINLECNICYLYVPTYKKFDKVPTFDELLAAYVDEMSRTNKMPNIYSGLSENQIQLFWLVYKSGLVFSAYSTIRNHKK